MASLSDGQLLGRFLQGDECALEALFERYEAPVFHFLLGMLRDHHLAEDALQDTFVKALLEAAAVQPDRFRGWLFTVAYREALVLKRKQKRRPAATAGAELGLPDPSPCGGVLAEQRDQAERVGRLLEQLPAPQRLVIHARIYEGKRYREIADELGCPLNTALARMHDGLKRLRRLWEGSHGRS